MTSEERMESDLQELITVPVKCVFPYSLDFSAARPDVIYYLPSRFSFQACLFGFIIISFVANETIVSRLTADQHAIVP